MSVFKRRLEDLERRSKRVGLHPTVCIISAEENNYSIWIQLWNGQTGGMREVTSKHNTLTDALKWRDNKLKEADIPTVIIDI